MQPYLNRSGDSGVLAYEIAPTSITVQFRKSGIYVYDYVKPGAEAVEKMKELAVAGRGLGTFISSKVKKKFASKLR